MTRREGSTSAFRNQITCPEDAGHRDVTFCKTREVWMIDKLQPRQIFSLDDQPNNSTQGHQRIIAMYKPITIIHEHSIIADEVNISSMKTRKSLTLVDSKCDKTVTACASLKKDSLRIQNNLKRRKKGDLTVVWSFRLAIKNNYLTTFKWSWWWRIR